MTTKVCHLKLLLIAAAVRLILCSDDAMFPGQARPDDPNACFWFEGPTGSSVFRCCNGYINTLHPTENCIECPEGSFGYFCNKNCSCENGGTCNRVDGSCHCSPQYFGISCHYPCNCLNEATCMPDGSCICANGFFGKLCGSQCQCPKKSTCDKETGKCICLDGFYGDACLSCNCSNTEQCNPLNGVCSCKPTYYGANCDNQCSCFNGAHCGIDRPNNCKCPLGWTGSKCTDCNKSKSLSHCEDKCLHCYNGHTCSVQYGNCECSPGWQGNRCDKKCNVGFYGFNCSEICNSHCEYGKCNPVDGSCQCESGWTGLLCEIPCPENCLLCEGNVCTSCKAGWIGYNCVEQCAPGFYGNGCKEICPECNCVMSCSHVSGICRDVVRCEEQKCRFLNAKTCMENPFKLECQDGLSGRLCDVKVDKVVNMTDIHNITVSPTGYDSSSTLYLAIIITVIVSVCVATAVVIVKLRMRQVAQRNTRCSEQEYGTQTIGKEISHNASVRKNNRVTQQNDAIETNSQDVEAAGLYAVIQGPAGISTSNEDLQQDRGTSDYENILRNATHGVTSDYENVLRNATKGEDYQQLRDFTHSEYQMLDLSDTKF